MKTPLDPIHFVFQDASGKDFMIRATERGLVMESGQTLAWGCLFSLMLDRAGVEHACETDDRRPNFDEVAVQNHGKFGYPGFHSNWFFNRKTGALVGVAHWE